MNTITPKMKVAMAKGLLGEIQQDASKIPGCGKALSDKISALGVILEELSAVEHELPRSEGTPPAINGHNGDDFKEGVQSEQILGEGVKELTCLYAMERAMHEDLSVDEFCQRAVEYLVPAMQFPEITIAVIELNGLRFTSKNYTEGLSHGLHAEIKSDGELYGHLGVYYAEERPFSIPEEQNLVNGVSQSLGSWLKRKQAEAELLDSRHMLQTVLDSIPAAVFWKNRDLIYLGGNRTWLEAVGMKSSEEVVGKSDYDLPWEKGQADSFREYDRRVLESGISEYDIIEPYLRSDGTHAWAKTNKVLLRDTDGNVVGILGTYEDITERRLLEQQTRFHSILLKAVGQSVIATDPEGSITYMNPAAESLYGWRADEALGRSILEVTVPKISHAQAVDIMTQLAEGLSWSGEFLVQHHDGTIFPVMIEDTPVFDEDGKLIGIIGVSSDITRRKQAEQSLQESERKFRLVAETIQDVFWISTPGITEMIYISPGYERIWRKSADSLYEIPSTFLEILHPEDLEHYLIIVEKYHAKGKSYECEYRILPEVGSVRWIRERGYPITDDQGNVVLMTGICTDITERKQAEEALTSSEARLSAILDMTPFPIALVDVQDENIELWSRSALTLFGHTAPTASEWYLMAYPDPDYRREVISRWKAPLEEARRSGQVANTGEYRVTCRDGSVRICELYATFLTDKLIVTFNDITERKQAEQALSESEEKFRNLFNNAEVGMFRTRLDGSEILDVNERFLEIFGRRRAEMQGSASVIHWADPRERQEMVRRLQAEGRVREFECGMLNKQGEVRKCLTSLYLYRAQGILEGSIIDITERVNSEAAIRHYTQQLEALHQASLAFSKLQSPQEVGERVLDTLEQLLGYRRGTIVLFDEKDDQLDLLAHARMGLDEKAYRAEFEHVSEMIKSKKGITRWVAEHSQPLRIGHVHEDDRYLVADPQIQSEMAVPLKIGVRTIGAINVESERPEAFSLEDERLLSTLANQAAIAIQNARLFTSVRTQREELRSLATRLAQVEEIERRNIARELHDRVGQNLTALSINLNMLRSLAPAAHMDAIAPFLDDSQKLIERTSERIRNVMAELRPPELDDYGLAAALRWFSGSFTVRNQIELEAPAGDLDPRPPGEVETALFRIAQEALTNIAKHAQATRATIVLSQEPGWLRMTITDNGIGFDPLTIEANTEGKRWGMLNMRERAEALDGQVRVESQPGKGTRVIVEVPV